MLVLRLVPRQAVILTNWEGNRETPTYEYKYTGRRHLVKGEHLLLAMQQNWAP